MEKEEAVRILRGAECLTQAMSAQETMEHEYAKEALWLIADAIRVATDALEG